MKLQERYQWLKGWNLLYVISCIVIMIACFLPYVYTGEQSLTLMEAVDGIFFLVFAILILIFLYVDKQKAVGVLSIVTVIFAVYELAHTFGVITRKGSTVSLRAGYFVLLLGMAGMLAGAVCYIYQNGLKQFLNKIFDKVS